MNVTRDDYVAATNTTYMYTYLHAYTHTYTHARARTVHTWKHAYTVAVTLEERNSQPCEMIRSKRTYLLTNTQPQRYASCIRDSWNHFTRFVII